MGARKRNRNLSKPYPLLQCEEMDSGKLYKWCILIDYCLKEVCCTIIFKRKITMKSCYEINIINEFMLRIMAT